MDTENGAAAAAPDAGTVETATPSNDVTTNSSDPWSAIDATMDQAYDRVNPSREANGQFKGEGNTEPDKTTETTVQDQAQTTATEPAKVIDAPQSWSAEKKALWPSLSPDAQTYISQREGEAHKRISELGQTVKAFEPIRNVIDHYKSDFQARNTDPARGFAALMEVQRMLDADFENGINEIAKVYGKPSPFAQNTTGDQESDTIRSLRSEIASLKQAVGQTRDHVMAEQKSKRDSEQASLNALVDEFSRDKTDFAEIESDLVAQIHAIRQAEPGLDNKELLAKAYERAQWANPTSRARLQEAQRKEEETRRAEEAKKKADDAKKASRINVKSSPNTTARRGSWEDTMDSFRQ